MTTWRRPVRDYAEWGGGELKAVWYNPMNNRVTRVKLSALSQKQAQVEWKKKMKKKPRIQRMTNVQQVGIKENMYIYLPNKYIFLFSELNIHLWIIN